MLSRGIFALPSVAKALATCSFRLLFPLVISQRAVTSAPSVSRMEATAVSLSHCCSLNISISISFSTQFPRTVLPATVSDTSARVDNRPQPVFTPKPMSMNGLAQQDTTALPFRLWSNLNMLSVISLAESVISCAFIFSIVGTPSWVGVQSIVVGLPAQSGSQHPIAGY